MSYSWTPAEALRLCDIQFNSAKKEVKIKCPFCDSNNFAMNLEKGIGHCWSCQSSADSAGYYAATFEKTLPEARKEIEEKLGIKSEKVLKPVKAKIEEKTEEKIADNETLDKTYSAFLNQMPLKDKTIINLKSRGFNEEEIRYKTFIQFTEAEKVEICQNLLSDGYTLRGVPGFYTNKAKNWTFIQLTQGTIMPCINYKGLITGLQIRKDDDCRRKDEVTGETEAKCSWFSSKDRENGTGAHANVHYACEFVSLPQKIKPIIKDKIFITEGIMKADLFHQIYPDIPLLAVPGVHATNGLKDELIRMRDIGVREVILAYDMDYKSNKSVEAALNRTKEIINETGFNLKIYEWNPEITIKGKKFYLKGIDDLAVFIQYGILPKEKSDA